MNQFVSKQQALDSCPVTPCQRRETAFQKQDNERHDTARAETQTSRQQRIMWSKKCAYSSHQFDIPCTHTLQQIKREKNSDSNRRSAEPGKQSVNPGGPCLQHDAQNNTAQTQSVWNSVLVNVIPDCDCQH